MSRAASRSPGKRKRAQPERLSAGGSGSYISDGAALESVEPQEFVQAMGVSILDALVKVRHAETNEIIARYFDHLPPNLPKRPAPPIALTAIRASILGGEYQNVYQVSQAVHLGFKATLVFYKRDSRQHEYARTLQAEANRFYHEEIPWADEWIDPNDTHDEADEPPPKRRSTPARVSSSQIAGPSRARKQSSVKTEPTPARIPAMDIVDLSTDEYEERDEDGEVILISAASVSRKGKGRASAASEGEVEEATSARSRSRTAMSSANESAEATPRSDRSSRSGPGPSKSSHGPVMNPARSTSRVVSITSPSATSVAPSSASGAADTFQQLLRSAQKTLALATQQQNEALGREYAWASQDERLQATEKELDTAKSTIDSLMYDNDLLTRRSAEFEALCKEAEAKLAKSEKKRREERSSHAKEVAAWKDKERARRTR